MVGSITWPSFFEPIKIGVWEIFLCTVFRGWCKISVFEKKLVKNGVSEKKLCTFFLRSFGFTSLLLHDGTRCFRRVCKKPYKNRFFWHTLLLDAEETEKKKKQKKKAPKKNNTQFLGGLENGHEVVPPCFSKKSFFFFFQNPQKTYFYSVSRKNGWQPFFFKKAMLQRGQT